MLKLKEEDAVENVAVPAASDRPKIALHTEGVGRASCNRWRSYDPMEPCHYVNPPPTQGRGGGGGGQ